MSRMIRSVVAKFCKRYKSHAVPVIGGTVFYYNTALGTCKHISEICCLESLRRVSTGCICHSYQAMHKHPTLRINTYSMAVPCCMAYTTPHPWSCAPQLWHSISHIALTGMLQYICNVQNPMFCREALPVSWSLHTSTSRAPTLRQTPDGSDLKQELCHHQRCQ